MGRCGRERVVRDFTVDAMVRGYARMFNEALEP
jgi:hypothetical protein